MEVILKSSGINSEKIQTMFDIRQQIVMKTKTLQKHLNLKTIALNKLIKN